MRRVVEHFLLARIHTQFRTFKFRTFVTFVLSYQKYKIEMDKIPSTYLFARKFANDAAKSICIPARYLGDSPRQTKNASTHSKLENILTYVLSLAKHS